jgi:hypothetical protein
VLAAHRCRAFRTADPGRDQQPRGHGSRGVLARWPPARRGALHRPARPGHPRPSPVQTPSGMLFPTCAPRMGRFSCTCSVSAACPSWPWTWPKPCRLDRNYISSTWVSACSMPSSRWWRPCWACSAVIAASSSSRALRLPRPQRLVQRQRIVACGAGERRVAARRLERLDWRLEHAHAPAAAQLLQVRERAPRWYQLDARHGAAVPAVHPAGRDDLGQRLARRFP